MPIKDFKVEKWLNPRDAQCRYNLGASCVKAISLDELAELSGENKDELTKFFFETADLKDGDPASVIEERLFALSLP